MRRFVLLFILTIQFRIADAQTAGANAVQQVQLDLHNAIELAWVNNNAVHLAFKSTTDFEKGVVSDPQQLRVCSQQKFDITIRAMAPHFTYNGVSMPQPTMPVDGVLSIRVLQNTTCGTVAAPFSVRNYHTIKDSDNNLIINGESCSAENISVVYRAAPGFAYPPGVYTVDIIYTATQQ
ncbi:MAG: hypothetical protein J0L80_15955 [Chitinophagales bacterium]|nr:hypothetical protein [Chitinophagales bacterium]